MFVSLMHFLNILMFLDISFAILCCILIVKLPTKYALKYALIPLLLSITYMSVVTMPDMLGRPFEGLPAGEFEFKDYRVIMMNKVKKIELWVIEDHKSRLYLIDYSDLKEETLAKAKSGAKQGRKQVGKFKKKDGPEGNGLDGPQLGINDVPLQQILPPKDD